MAARRRRPHVLAVLGTLALGASAASPAIAAPRVGGSLRLAGTASTPRASSATNATNQAFAGELVAQKGATSVGAQFKLTKLTCTSADTGVGPGAFVLSGPTDHEQFSFAGIILGCTHGTVDPSHEALVVNGVESDYGKALHVGDQLMVRLTINATSTIAQFSDLTPGHRVAVQATGRGGPAQLELVGEYAVEDTKTGAQLQVPNFGTLHFSSASVGGSPIGSDSPTAYDMKSSHHVIQISTGPLSASNDGFPSVYDHA